MYFLSLLLLLGAWWGQRKLGVVSLEALIFHIRVPLAGMDTTMVGAFLLWCVLPSAICAAVLAWGVKRRAWWLSAALMLAALLTAGKTMEADAFLRRFAGDGRNTVFDTDYVAWEPGTVMLERKKNVVFVFMESLERTYADEDVFAENLIPGLSALEGISVPDHRQVSGAGWTIAGITSYLLGLPLWLPFDGNEMDKFERFLPGASGLSDILADNGYDLHFLQGAGLGFSGKDRFFTDHGFPSVQVRGYHELVAEAPERAELGGTDWGLRDSLILDQAKAKLEQLSEKDQPFALFVLTLDTHFPSGYVDPLCVQTYGDYRDVVRCADSQVSGFVAWMRAQPWYDNTLVVLVSDHLSMAVEGVFEEYLLPNHERRRNFNLILNAEREIPSAARSISHFDLLPTVLEAMGAELPSHRLGLGVSLFTDEPTLVERYGDDLDGRLQVWSRRYNSFFR